MNDLRQALEMGISALENSTPHPREEDDDYAEQGHREHFRALAALQEELEKLGGGGMSKWAPVNKSNIASCMHVRIVDDDGVEICIVTWQGREQTTNRLAEKICELANKEGREE